MNNCCKKPKDIMSIKRLAEQLKIIAEPNRLKVLCLLSLGTKCVCEIEENLKLKQNLISHHLKVLKDSGLVTLKKEGQWRHYSLNEKSVRELKSLFMKILKEKSPKSN